MIRFSVINCLTACGDVANRRKTARRHSHADGFHRPCCGLITSRPCITHGIPYEARVGNAQADPFFPNCSATQTRSGRALKATPAEFASQPIQIIPIWGMATIRKYSAIIQIVVNSTRRVLPKVLVNSLPRMAFRLSAVSHLLPPKPRSYYGKTFVRAGNYQYMARDSARNESLPCPKLAKWMGRLKQCNRRQRCIFVGNEHLER